MANEVKIQGNDVMLSVWDGSAYRPVACLTTNSNSSSISILEASTKCDNGGVSKNYGAYSESHSFEGQYIDTTSVGGYTTQASHDWLKAKQRAKEKITYKFDRGLADSNSEYGYAIITDLELTGPANEVSTFTGTFDVDGVPSTTDPNA